MGARSSGEACAAHECGDHGALEIGAQVGASGTRWYDGAQWAQVVHGGTMVHGSTRWHDGARWHETA